MVDVYEANDVYCLKGADSINEDEQKRPSKRQAWKKLKKAAKTMVRRSQGDAPRT